MKKPIMKTYVIDFSGDTEKEEREFEKMLEEWRKEKRKIFMWRKFYSLKGKFGDE